MTTLTTELAEYYCGNPCCPATLRHHPRVVLVGSYAPGTMAQSLPCPACSWRTWVIIADDGSVEYRAQRGWKPNV